MQNDDYKIEDSEFIRSEGVEKQVSEKQTFSDYGK